MTSRSVPRLASLALALVLGATLVLLAAAVVAAESPAPGGSGPASAGPAASGGNAISIVQKTFSPSTLTVHVGDTVTWTVTEAISDPHSVTAGSSKDPKPAEFDSGIKLKNNGDTFSHAFPAAGTFSFFCAVHPTTMSGTITVTGANGGTGAPAAKEGVPTSSKLIAGVVLVVALLLLFGWARIYRRMNPAL
jgi:plastocyanin